MTKLKKMIFNAKQYQFGYNDAMNVAFENERELKALIEELERTNKKHCKAHLMSIDKIDKLQAKVEELKTAVKDLVGVTQDSFYVRHYLRTHYPALKQEGEL